MVEAQIVREVEQEPAANDKPEPWLAAEAVWLPAQPVGDVFAVDIVSVERDAWRRLQTVCRRTSTPIRQN